MKICGLTSADACRWAVEAGADLLGFNFWPRSKRYVTPEAAATLCARAPDGVTRVGVFVDASEEEVREALARCPLDLLQFHGDETPGFCRRFGVPFMKAFRLSGPEVVARIGDYLDGAEHPFLVDAWVSGQMGGTGERVSQDLAARARRLPGRMVLAGGLRPENVAEAVATLAPWAVDVASGVEDPPPVKSRERIVAFMAAVRAADEQEAAA